MTITFVFSQYYYHHLCLFTILLITTQINSAGKIGSILLVFHKQHTSPDTYRHVALCHLIRVINDSNMQYPNNFDFGICCSCPAVLACPDIVPSETPPCQSSVNPPGTRLCSVIGIFRFQIRRLFLCHSLYQLQAALSKGSVTISFFNTKKREILFGLELGLG